MESQAGGMWWCMVLLNGRQPLLLRRLAWLMPALEDWSGVVGVGDEVWEKNENRKSSIGQNSR